MKRILLPVLVVGVFGLLISASYVQAQGGLEVLSIFTTTDSSLYGPTSDINITITAQNNLTQAQVLYFDTSCQVRYSIVNASTGATVYNSADNGTCIPTYTSVPISASSSKTWTLTYSQSSSNALGGGTYNIVGEVIGYGKSTKQININGGIISNTGTTRTIPQDLMITTESLRHAVVGIPYSTSIEGIGGSDIYLWNISNLPPDLRVNQAVCIMSPCLAPVTISGTPTTSGIYNLTVQLQSGNRTVYKIFILTVSDGKASTVPQERELPPPIPPTTVDLSVILAIKSQLIVLIQQLLILLNRQLGGSY